MGNSKPGSGSARGDGSDRHGSERRGSDRGDSQRGDSGRSGGDKRSHAPRAGASGQGERKPWSKDGAPARTGGPHPSGDKALWTHGGRPARGDRDAHAAERVFTEEERLARELRSVRPRHDDPDIPDDVQADELDRIARNELKTLSKDNAEGVARHLVMAARMIDDDPELAHRHALSAARRAGRIAIVRESLAITAYATGDYALALRELRTYRRISGKNDQLPLMVDSERAVDRPDRALELGRSVPRSSLPPDVQVALAIAMSGARLDLGQPDAALAELQIPQLDPHRAFAWSPDLFFAYAEVLDELGRERDAATWRERATRAEEALGASGDDEVVKIVEEDMPADLAATTAPAPADVEGSQDATEDDTEETR